MNVILYTSRIVLFYFIQPQFDGMTLVSMETVHFMTQMIELRLQQKAWYPTSFISFLQIFGPMRV